MSDNVSIAMAAYGEDCWKAFLERPKVFRFFVRLFMGRYAWNELIGIKETYEKNHGTGLANIGYGLEYKDYHKEFDKYKDW
jgi:hypothetical protein